MAKSSSLSKEGKRDFMVQKKEQGTKQLVFCLFFQLKYIKT